MTTITLKQFGMKQKSITAAIAVISAVALPQIFHAVGAVSGLGTTLGAAFLPMHIPVFIAGMMAGPLAGLAAGILSPMISFMLSGMPVAAMVPLMVIELAMYGLFAGLLNHTKLPVLVQLLIAQLAGRIVRAVAILASIYILGSQSMSLSSTWTILLAGLPGILLQWALIPLFMYRMKGAFGNER